MSLYSTIDRFVLMPIGDKLMRRNISGAYKGLLKTEFCLEAELKELQNNKLKNLLRHCYTSVPYYRRVFDERHITPDDIKSREDLYKLPILTKKDVREHFDELISGDINKRKYLNGSTGGSTGTPMRFLEDISSWNILRGLNFRGWSWAGFNVGEKLFTLGGNSLVSKNHKVSPFSAKALYDRFIMRNLKRDCTDITDPALMLHYKAMMKFRPTAIRGYASSLFFLARYLEQNHLPVPKVKAVFTTGEKLHSEYRLKIESVFNAKVFDGYGAADGGVSAHECAIHDGLHIAEEQCIVEIADNAGNVLPDGETGNILTTDLSNYVFPFIRYKVGDLAYIKKELCSCGRKHRLLGEIIGREGRAIYNKQGRPFSSIVIDNMMFKDLDIHSSQTQRLYEKMERFQIRQDKFGDLTILIKPVDPSDSEASFGYVLDNFRSFFPDSRVVLKIVDDIPTLPSGKEDYCVSDYNTA